MKIFQKGFNYGQDGDGNRLVYHLQGCNMKCPWCSNPEGMNLEGALMVLEEWLIPDVCPKDAIADKTINREKCKSCDTKDCVTKHTTKGVQLSCKTMTVDEVVEEILNNRMMYYDGGGVTFTGGESTMQFTELLEILKRVKAEGVHTAIETNASHIRLAELFPYVDQLITDCKLIDDKRHQEIVGIPSTLVLENIAKACQQHGRVHLRIPLIGGVNNDEKSLQEFLGFLAGLEREHLTVEVLNYHEYGKLKWERCGMLYTPGDEAYIDKGTNDRFVKMIKELGLDYKKT